MSSWKYVPPDFWRDFLNRFLLTPAVYFSYNSFLRIFSASLEGPGPGIFGGKTQKEEIWGKQPRKQSISSKTGNIPEKYIWRSWSLVNQQFKNLQKLTFKLKKFKLTFKLKKLVFKRKKVKNSYFWGKHDCFLTEILCHWNKQKLKKKLRKNFQVWSLHLRTPISIIHRAKHKIIRHTYWSH